VEPTQRFNHIAMTVPAEQLDESGCAEILRFYRDVFAWSEMPGLTEAGRILVLRAHSNEQFVFIVAGDAPMRCGDMDHFGLSAETPAELDGLLGRAQAFQEHDERVRIVDRKTEDFGVLKLHNFYVGHLLPLLVEVQCYEWAEGVGPDSLPKP
jgi:hypothetical protein